MATRSLRIILIEDQQLFSESMANSLRNRIGATILGIYPSAEAVENATAVLEQTQVALVDIRLSDTEAFDLVIRLRESYPNLRLIWVTSMVGDYLFQRALDARLPGFVLKTDPIDVLVAAIETVATGGAYQSEAVLGLQTQLRLNTRHFNQLLSAREQEVLRYVGSGYSNDEVATLLGLREGTIHSHRRNIMAKLKLHTTVDLMVYAVRHGFADPNKLKADAALPPTAP